MTTVDLRQATPRTEFPSPFDFRNREPVTLVELRMRFYSGKIRAKPLWWEKVRDEGIVAKWRAEIVENDGEMVERFWGGEKRTNEVMETDDGDHRAKPWPREPISEAQLDYIVEELRYEAGRRDEETGAFVSYARPGFAR